MLECVVNEHVLDLLGKLFFRGCLFPWATFLFHAVPITVCYVSILCGDLYIRQWGNTYTSNVKCLFTLQKKAIRLIAMLID